MNNEERWLNNSEVELKNLMKLQKDIGMFNFVVMILWCKKILFKSGDVL